MGTTAFKRPETAQQAVLAALQRMIVTGELVPGTPIVQDALAEQFGMSRVPVREALRILEGEGKVVHTAHHGYRVTRLAVSDLLEIYRLRRVLEREVTTEAVPRLTAAHLGQMRAAMDDIDRAADVNDIIAMGVANREFHFALLEASEMPHALRIVRQLWDTTDPYRRLYFQRPVTRENVNREHQLILEACERHDVDEVVALLDVHRDHAVDDLLALTSTW